MIDYEIREKKEEKEKKFVRVFSLLYSILLFLSRKKKKKKTNAMSSHLEKWRGGEDGKTGKMGNNNGSETFSWILVWSNLINQTALTCVYIREVLGVV